MAEEGELSKRVIVVAESAMESFNKVAADLEKAVPATKSIKIKLMEDESFQKMNPMWMLESESKKSLRNVQREHAAVEKAISTETQVNLNQRMASEKQLAKYQAEQNEAYSKAMYDRRKMVEADQAKAEKAAEKAAKAVQPMGEYAGRMANQPLSLDELRDRRIQSIARGLMINKNLTPEDAMRAAPLKYAADSAKEHDKLAESYKKVTKEAKDAKEPLTILGKFWKDLSTGHIRGGFASVMSSGLGAAGIPQPIAASVGAMSGGIASSLALPIAWAIGNAIMQIPSMILHGREVSDRFRAAGKTPEEREGLAAMEEQHRMAWEMASKGGGEEWLKGSEHLQDVGMDRNQAARTMNRLSILGLGTAGGKSAMAEEYEQAFRTKDPRDILAIVKGNTFLREQVIKEHPEIARRAEKYRDPMIAALVGTKGSIEDLDAWMEQAASRRGLPAQRVASGAQSGAGMLRGVEERAAYSLQHPLEGVPWYVKAKYEKEARNELWGSISHKEWYEMGDVGQDVRVQKMVDRRLRAERGISPDLDTLPWEQDAPEAGPHDWRNPPRVARSYQWTSFTGMAEQMQVGHSGAPFDYQQQAVTELGEIKNILQERLPHTPRLSGHGVGEAVISAAGSR